MVIGLNSQIIYDELVKSLNRDSERIPAGSALRQCFACCGELQFDGFVKSLN
jgi:hypothetical protein